MQHINTWADALEYQYDIHKRALL